MTLEKALEILGLESNFTEEQLKSAHRKLAKEYHPDFHEKSDDRIEKENKMKEINEARDYLATYLKSGRIDYNSNTTNSYQNNSSSEFYRRQKINELKNKIYLDKDKLNLSDNIKSILIEIDQIYLDFCISAYQKNNWSIDKSFHESRRKIEKKFEIIRFEFYKENAIYEYEVIEKIYYECTLKEFYDQLLKIKEKYSRKLNIRKKLEQETSKYKTYTGYEENKERIEEYINDTLLKIANNGYRYTQKDIDNMHQEISQIFQKYYSLKNKISELASIVATIDDDNIKRKYTLVERNFLSGISYSSIENYIPTLESLIYQYQQKNKTKIAFKQNEQAINEIYKSLIARYSEVIKNYNIVTVTGYAAINNLNEFLNEILNVFKNGCNNYQSLDYFNLFNEITFKSVANDSKILKTILKKLESTSTKIYIKKKDSYNDERNFYYLDENEMIMYEVIGESVFSIKIDLEELSEDYISLDELLNKSRYIGRDTTNMPDNQIFIIYTSDEYIIYKDNEKDEQIKIKVNPQLSTTIFYSMYKNDKYQDKKYLSSLIKEQVEQKIESIKQIKKTHSQNSNNDGINFIDIDNINIDKEQFIDFDGIHYNASQNNGRRR